MTQKLNKISARDALTFLCFVCVAAALWFGHALGSVRDAVVHIPIRYEGVSEDYDFSPVLPDAIDITLHDAGRRLLHEQHDAPEIHLDLSRQMKGRQGDIVITTEQLLQMLPTNLQGSGTAKIRNIEPDRIQSHYTERYTERVFSLPIHTIGVPAGITLRLFPATAQVTVQIPQSKYNAITEDDLLLRCHYPTHPTDRLPLEVQVHNKLISGTRVTPDEVEYIIEK